MKSRAEATESRGYSEGRRVGVGHEGAAVQTADVTAGSTCTGPGAGKRDACRKGNVGSEGRRLYVFLRGCFSFPRLEAEKVST